MLQKMGLQSFVTYVFPAMRAVKSWGLLFCKIEDAYATSWTKCYREDPDVAFGPTFRFDVEFTAANRAVTVSRHRI